MGMFDQFNNVFSVGNTISQTANTQPDDVLKTKSVLAQTGDYKVPDYGLTDIPDMGMIDGLKKFQQKNGLKVDGIMKPGGPTEAKISETLVNQAARDTDELETTQANPKASKSDPSYSAKESKNPTANPWFKSSKIKPVEDETHSANTRTMDGLLQYSKNGSLPALYADSLKKGEEKAIHEYANFMQQLSDRKGDRVDEFHQEVVARLPENMKQAFAELEVDNDVNGTSKNVQTNAKSSQRIRAESAVNLQQELGVNEPPNQKVTGETIAKSDNPMVGEKTPCNQAKTDIEVAETTIKEAQKAVDSYDKDLKQAELDFKNYTEDLHSELISLQISVTIDIVRNSLASVPGLILSAASTGLSLVKAKRLYTSANEAKNAVETFSSRKTDEEKIVREYTRKLTDAKARKQQHCK